MTCKRCHRKIKPNDDRLGRVCREKAKTEVLDDDLYFEGGRHGSQYAGRR